LSLLLLLLLLLLVLLVATGNWIPHGWHMAISPLVVAAERHDGRLLVELKVVTEFAGTVVKPNSGPLGLGVSGVYLV
jgi:hypothetical protein